MDFLKKLDNEDKMLIGAVAVSGCVLGYMYWKKKKDEREAAAAQEPEKDTAEVPVLPKSSTPPISNTTTILNKNLVLKKSSKGLEVRALQTKLGVKADGDFGSITETALVKAKGVKSISLNGFDGKIGIASTTKKPAITPDVPFKKGQNIMVGVRSGFTAQTVSQRADGSYYTDGTNINTGLKYGQKIGVIKSVLTRPDGLVRYVVENEIFNYNNKRLLWIAHKNVDLIK